MKSFKVIAKLHKKRIDDLQSEISQVNNLIQELENKKNNYIESFNKQTDFLNNNNSFVFDSKSFFEFINAQIITVEYEIKNSTKIVEHLSNELVDAFNELKKIDIFIKNKNIKESQELAKKELALMNEIALINFIKNK